MFVDEISMADLSMINTMNRCSVARSLNRSSTGLFGEIPVIIFMGDFYQFPPVKGPALWKEPRKGIQKTRKAYGSGTSLLMSIYSMSR